MLLTTAGAVSVQNNILQAVHLRQGSADGACGAYSVMMTLLILGQLEYDAITALNPVDRRKRAGRFQTGLEKFPGLLQQGMDIGEMSKLLHSFNRVLATIEEQQPEQCWQFILGAVLN
ncbi:hypothetical protein [Hymenobacter sp. ISL-91]|uniref:hypothetical protein n=1 Tax=Hymenobacter sp. ISL-91 TaxID=2819151 RepID=UPI001BE56610|nr:hypothetical protein [Hymenobacter sp. ISL-91]